jgi:hypothetical protein
LCGRYQVERGDASVWPEDDVWREANGADELGEIVVNAGPEGIVVRHHGPDVHESVDLLLGRLEVLFEDGCQDQLVSNEIGALEATGFCPDDVTPFVLKTADHLAHVVAHDIGGTAG